MKKLSAVELNALRVLDRQESICPGTATGAAAEVAGILSGLARRKLADVEGTDDGPVFTINSRGRAEARK